MQIGEGSAIAVLPVADMVTVAGVDAGVITRPFADCRLQPSERRGGIAKRN